MSKRYCLLLDLKDNAQLIKEYEEHHRKVWPEIISSIKNSGIINMEIYRKENRLFMIMEVNDDFSFDKKRQADEANEKVQQWENLMWKYQQHLPFASKGEKWLLMDEIFKLSDF